MNGSLIKIPDYPAIVALLTAAAIIAQGALPAGNHWSTSITAVVGFVLVHLAPSASSGTRTTGPL